jgi:hypothetical protein
LHTQPKIPKFQQVQYQFSGHIRDPENIKIPDDVEQRRMTIYRDLFYNNIEGFLASAFPVLKTITSNERWHSMVRDFIVKHQCKSPLFHEISREFLSYLDDERDLSNDPIFIKSLCHYEWVELALSISDSEVVPVEFDADVNSLSLQLNTSPLAWPLSYPFPVHQISHEFQPQQASETPIFLLVYRSKDDKIVFMELNPVSARLIDLLNTGLTGLQAAEQIAEELQHPNPQVVINGAKMLIDDWLKRGILIFATP